MSQNNDTTRANPAAACGCQDCRCAPCKCAQACKCGDTCECKPAAEGCGCR